LSYDAYADACDDDHLVLALIPQILSKNAPDFFRYYHCFFVNAEKQLMEVREEGR